MPGKRADFGVLEQSAFQVSPRRIHEIEIWGTIYEARVLTAPWSIRRDDKDQRTRRRGTA